MAAAKGPNATEPYALVGNEIALAKIERISILDGPDGSGGGKINRRVFH